MLATCWVASLTALDNAASSAKTIIMSGTQARAGSYALVVAVWVAARVIVVFGFITSCLP
jgi:hypothetical protein